MRGTTMIAVLAMALCTVAIDAAAQQPEASMTIAGIPGKIKIRTESTDWLQIKDMPDPQGSHVTDSTNPLTSRAGSLSSSRGGTSGAQSGKVQHQDISIDKYIDNASPKLDAKCLSGEVIPKVSIEIRNAGRDRRQYYIIQMSNVVISDVSSLPGGSGDRPGESVTLSYESLTWEARPAGGYGQAATPHYPVTPRPR